jgi:PIN domain nuclease of toxin-antitoxin system
MSYLLDTHVLIWLLAGSPDLSQHVLDILSDPRHAVSVSVASAWEMAIKVGLGKLELPPDVRHWLPGELAAADLSVLPVTLEHALGVERLPRHHADPFDRLLIAQARAGGHTLVSADRIFDRYDVPLLRC